MADPPHPDTDSDQAQTERGDFTVTLTGWCTQDAWERLAADLEEIRRPHP